MIRITFVWIIFASTICHSQTKAIAYKSHSGNPLFFDASATDNLGLSEPSPTLDSIVKIDDSTIVQYYNTYRGPYYYDTIINDLTWINAQLNLDSLNKLHQGRVQLIGFQETQSLKTARMKKKRNSIYGTSTQSDPNSNRGLMLLGITLIALIVLVQTRKQTSLNRA